ncbi:hypothetical protein ACVINI_007203 [Rhizobium beringeri]
MCEGAGVFSAQPGRDHYLVYLDTLGKFAKQFCVPLQMMNLLWIAFRKRGHRFHVGPVGDRREPCLILTIFAQQLNVECCL